VIKSPLAVSVNEILNLNVSLTLNSLGRIILNSVSIMLTITLLVLVVFPSYTLLSPAYSAYTLRVVLSCGV
jgi:hypothetical protein